MNRTHSKNIHHAGAVKPVRVDEKTNLVGLLEQFSNTSFQSRNLYRVYRTLDAMETDLDRPVVFLSLAGGMVPAGMKNVIMDMMKRNMVDVIVSTGANITHDVCEALGYSHYVGSDEFSDVELRKSNLVRIYDTYLSGASFIAEGKLVLKVVSKLEKREYSSREFLHHLGNEINTSKSFLATASKLGLPVFCPALNDCDIGIALTKNYVENTGERKFLVNPIRDNFEIYQVYKKAVKTGIVIIGGGVPRNYTQQVPVIEEVITGRMSKDNLYMGYNYGVLITTDDPKWGGLSGCTFSESLSWGKYSVESYTATVYCDATIAFPLVVGAVIQKSGKKLALKSRIKLEWKEDKLLNMVYEKPLVASSKL